MPIPPRGLRHIKTLKIGMSIGAISNSRVLAKKQTLRKRVSKELSRAWLFTAEPDFARYQQNLHVLKVEQPHLDIFNEVNSLILVAQIPGIHEKAVQIEIYGDVLRLEADAVTRSGHVRYYKEILLPFEVDTTNISSSYKEGILQLDLKRASEITNDKAW